MPDTKPSNYPPGVWEGSPDAPWNCHNEITCEEYDILEKTADLVIDLTKALKELKEISKPMVFRSYMNFNYRHDSPISAAEEISYNIVQWIEDIEKGEYP